jgi:glycosyltransferase involved in cell wall biosynthesis
MKVLAVASYPIEAAATRYRLAQFVAPLHDRGIEVAVRPFLDSSHFRSIYSRRKWPHTAAGLMTAAMRRCADLGRLSRADVLLVQREAMLFGPPVFEWLASRVWRRPIVLDLDDATFVPYTSPTFGRLGRFLKWFSKTDDLIRWSRIVTCGNRMVADYVADHGGVTRLIPTVVDTDLFCPTPKAGNDSPVLGWIGTHSTFPYLESIFPVLQELAQTYSFRLRIVGSGRDEVTIPGVEVINLPWELDREVEDFQSIDIGLYPIDSALYANQWAAGKSGFKAIQYMAVGVPYVATPVGGAGDIGEEGTTHFFASGADEWQRALEMLIGDGALRTRMGAAGREHATSHYSLPAQADKLTAALREAAGQS